MLNNIPTEMRNYPQWVVWRLEDTDAGKPTKVPYDAKTGRLASSTDPATWCKFDVACAALESGRYTGVGFVLSDFDPFAFIDLDDAEGDEDKHARQVKIFETFESYAELSPSGKGLHIIVKGSVPVGRKRDKVEVYSSKRFMTMTGNVYRDWPITEYQGYLSLLWEEMGRGAAALIYGQDQAQRDTDEAILLKAANATNGDKFRDLYEGRWNNHYASQSEADFAYVDIVGFYTQNRDQIARLFHMSHLGQRDKAKRPDYVASMVNRSFDRQLPPIDFDGLRNQIEEAIALKAASVAGAALGVPQPDTTPAPGLPPPPAPDQAGLGDVAQAVGASEATPTPAYHLNSAPASTLPTVGGLTVPPGLTGELAQFIYAQAPRQVPEIALAGAIGLMAGVCGRAYNVSGTGLNQYVLLLAPTGTGKEAIASGVAKLMAAVQRTVPGASEFVGPGKIVSDAALLKYISKRSACFYAMIGEFGLTLKQLSAHNANAHQIGLKQLLLDLFNKSGHGNVLGQSIYSDKANDTEIVRAPNVTLIGESTPEEFYTALDDSMVASGLLPRFFAIEYLGERPPLNKAGMWVYPDERLVDRLGKVCAYSLQLQAQGQVINVGYDPDAEAMLDEYEKQTTAQINSAPREVIRHLWNRAHVKALKLAALIAVGCGPYQPTITAEIAKWSIDAVNRDVLNILGKFERGEVGEITSDQKQIDAVKRVMQDYILRPYGEIASYCSGLAMHNDRVIPAQYVNKRLVAMASFRHDKRGASAAINATLKTLIEHGSIREVGRNDMSEKYNTAARAYMISAPWDFGL